MVENFGYVEQAKSAGIISLTAARAVGTSQALVEPELGFLHFVQQFSHILWQLQRMQLSIDPDALHGYYQSPSASLKLSSQLDIDRLLYEPAAHACSSRYSHQSGVSV